ncbi:hypothetical protein GCM10028803_57070 [Larkinella knui]|uniref:DUF4249 domain-containing protein n=1 Tax=Larkinella knui TaxID=2025310 RepID=A0A3P1CHU4_9BACT|nr:DUF4249 domain-containing protein [Larkinella knui]RRB12847.1 DUF4249 domain-containing protein [Larkinella knui]
MRLILPLFLLLVLTACESLVNEVDPDKLPKVDKKIVVQCYISPQDTLLKATVSLSKAVLGTNDNTYFADYKVTLSEGNRSIELKFNQALFAFVADPGQFPIETGKTYRLRVQGQQQSVEAVCTVPPPVTLTSIKLDSVRRSDGPSGSPPWEYYIRASWQDPAGAVNFYRLAGDYEFLQVTTNSSPGRPPTQNSQWNLNQIGFQNNNSLISDQGQDGQVLTSQRGYIYISSYAYSSSSGGSVYTYSSVAKRPITISVYLLHVDPAYYSYHHALELQNAIENNPFAEPVLIPGNIQGGLGCFGAYNRTTKTVVLK